MSLKKLQEAAGVKPDGVFGPNTFKACGKYLKIKDKVRAAHFFAQVGHETGNFRVFEENLNYSWKGLRSVFRKYFPTDELAKQYERKPILIASRVYGNRMGNGDEASQEGWKYRGRGAIQLTGKNNYKAFMEYQGDECIVEEPELVLNNYSFESAMFFFEKNGIWRLADEGINDDAIKKVTRRINGGYNGLEHRKELTYKYSKYSY
jgi:putative chitinase